MEAIFEVYTDLLVESADGFVDQALLWILRQDIKEFCVRVYQLIGLNHCMQTFSNCAHTSSGYCIQVTQTELCLSWLARI